ncbi:MAG: ferrous iron transport protein B [Ignavibacteria bacterium]|nr:ferrous iron transport protein B [Ignavibacteria bacterium]
MSNIQTNSAKTIPTNIAIVGNPNCGKTTLFNALTGLKQKVGNYPGVTVEKKEGKISLGGTEITLLDLPGTYSLISRSPDEKISADILLGQNEITEAPQTVICVVDASNLERNLFLTSQIIDLQIPVIIALTMNDNAEQSGITVDAKKLSQSLGVPVIKVNAPQKKGIDKLLFAITDLSTSQIVSRQWKMPEEVERSCSEIQQLLSQEKKYTSSLAFFESLRLLSVDDFHSNGFETLNNETKKKIETHLKNLDESGIDRRAIAIESRYSWIQSVCQQVLHIETVSQSISDKLDKIFTHKVWGFAVFLTLMGFMFHAIFTWANYPMELIGSAVSILGEKFSEIIPTGDFQDLIVNGVFAGVGAVVMFLPQILLLFFFLGLLEDTGYMSRAAFIMDKLMSKFGLHGKSFIPLLSSFACAIPGIMATRTIENRKDRIATILVAPLMSCSARLPVYTLMIATFIPNIIIGIFSLPALIMCAMYIVGIVAALVVATIFKKTLLKSAPAIFLMELPQYRKPSLKTVGLYMWEQAYQFLKSAGTIILGVSIILWFLATYPKMENATSSQRLEHSFAGRIGQTIEPVIEPLGFNWKIGVGLIGSLLQREVFVSTMGTMYNIEDENSNASLIEKMQNDVDEATGKKIFTPLVAICLMIYYVLSMQCMSTIAVTKRETNGWKWPAVQFSYMTVLAYSVTFTIHFIGTVFGF